MNLMEIITEFFAKLQGWVAWFFEFLAGFSKDEAV